MELENLARHRVVDLPLRPSWPRPAALAAAPEQVLTQPMDARMNAPHPYAEILRAIADGKEIQWKRPTAADARWADQSWADTLEEIMNDSWPPECYRIKPDVVVINGREVPAPLRELPPLNTAVAWVDLTYDRLVDHTAEMSNNMLYERLLSRGLLHASPEAARAHAEALISLTKQP